jgi:hypothetical protein
MNTIGKQEQDPRRYENPDYLKKMFAAGVRASQVGFAVLDSQTRFESVTESLAHETRASADDHMGRTSREIVGELAGQIEPTYEHVLRTGKAASVVLTGHVRDTPEYGNWLDHCFPVFDNSGKVAKLGLFVINTTAEQTMREMLKTLTIDPSRMDAHAASLLRGFDNSVKKYHVTLSDSLELLAMPTVEEVRKADHLRSSLQELDDRICGMRQVIYELISQFSIPVC